MSAAMKPSRDSFLSGVQISARPPASIPLPHRASALRRPGQVAAASACLPRGQVASSVQASAAITPDS